MIGNGQWSTTRDMPSAQLYLDEIAMQEDLRRERIRRRRELWLSIASGLRRLIHRTA